MPMVTATNYEQKYSCTSVIMNIAYHTGSRVRSKEPNDVKESRVYWKKNEGGKD